MKAYELLDTPDKWTQGSAAKTLDGNRCMAVSEEATCWCVVGAIIRCWPTWDASIEQQRLLEAHIGMDAVRWNDSPDRTYDEVVAALRELDI